MTTKQQINKLPKPTKQIEEVLYYLIKRHTINRRQMMLDTGILNVTARIANLRNKYNLTIDCNMLPVVNKFGRPIKYGLWRLENKQEGIDLYKKLQKN